MLFSQRTLDAPSLGVHYVDAEVRTPHLRIAVRSGTNVTTDYALLGRSVPYAHRMSRPQISILFDGEGRLDEGGKRVWMRAGQLCLSDGGGQRGGSMAYTGDQFLQLLVEWDPALHGVPWDASLATSALAARDRARLRDVATRVVVEATAPAAIRELFAILRSVGIPLELDDLPVEVSPMSAVNAAVARWLSSLDRFPSIDDVAADVRWNQRRVHRAVAALARQYAVPWSDWRSALHAFRILNATRLLRSPRATTEEVARLTGFRSPSALCHAFANANLPSPGALTRAARGSDVLEAWADPRLA